MFHQLCSISFPSFLKFLARHVVLSKMSLESVDPCQKLWDIWSCLLLSEMFMQCFIHGKSSLISGHVWSCPKSPDSQASSKYSWYLVTFVSVQKVYGVIWSMEKVLDIWSYLVLSKRSLRPVVHTKMSLIFCAWYLWQIQRHLSWTTHTIGCFAQDQISKMFWPGPKVYWMFWTWPRVCSHE